MDPIQSTDTAPTIPDEAPLETKDVESPEELEARVIKHVLDCKDESIKYYTDKYKKFAYFENLYHKGAAKVNVPYGRANLELPLAFQQVEPFVSQMSEAMIGEAPIITYQGRMIEDDGPAEKITDFTQYQLETGGFSPAYISYLRNLAKLGTAVMKCIWERDAITVTDPQMQMVPTGNIITDPNTGVGIPEHTQQMVDVEREFVHHDGPSFYNKSLNDFFVPKSATSSDVQKMDWVIDRVYKDLEDLLLNPNYEKGFKKVKDLIDEKYNDEYYGGSSGSKTFSSSDDPKRAELQQKSPKGLEKFSDQCELLEYWGRFNWVRGEPSKETLIVVAICNGEKILLRFEENPTKFKFKPFLMSNDYPIDGEPYGYGELDHIKGLVEESTALRNARLDVANISLNRVWLVERQAGVNLRELYTAPNQIIQTNDMNGIRPLDMGGITPSSVQELARIDFDIQNTTDIVNPRQDVSSVGGAFQGTATGVNYLSSKTNIRLLTKSRIQEETFFKPLAMMMNWYNQELITAEVYYRVTNDDQCPYRTLDPSAFETQVDFKPVSSPEKLSLLQRKENIGYVLQTVGQIEKVAPGTTNLQELLPEFYKSLGYRHPEKFVNPIQTTVIQAPDGSLLDKNGKPVQVVPYQQIMQQQQQQKPPMAA